MQYLRAAACLEQARRAIEAEPSNPHAYLLLSDIYYETAQYDLALYTVNAIPVQSLACTDSLMGVPYDTDPHSVALFRPTAMTGMPPINEESQITQPSGVEERLCWDSDLSDDEADDGDEEDEEHPKEECDKDLKLLQGRRLQGVAHDIYSLLVKLNAAVGWEGLLAIRSDVFYMEGEDDASEVPKVVASRWLDALIHLLYEDLKQMNKWKLEANEAETLQQEQETPAGDKDLPLYDVQDRPSLDWFYRGKLAERLLRFRSAVQAYRMSCFKGQNIQAYISLINLYARHGMLKEALQAITQLLTALYPLEPEDAEMDRSSGCLNTDKDILRQPVHPIVRQSIFTLISQYGLVQVRSTLASICESAHYLLCDVLTDAVQLRVHGFDANSESGEEKQA